MAQGPAKKAKPPAARITQRKQTGNRVIKPKKTALIKQNSIKKRHSAGLAAVTEKALAGKAGHLEILRGGKKDKKKQAEEAGNSTKGKKA